MTSTIEDIFLKSKPGDLGIFGYPIGHSLSPFMQNPALEFWWNNLLPKKNEAPPIYHKFSVPPSDLKAALFEAKKNGLLGLNVTIPHKEHIIPYLDECDAFAKEVGSVNTVLFSSGVSKGYNTDAEGFIDSLQGIGFNPQGQRVIVLGAGGTGTVLVAKLFLEGVKKIFWWNRTPSRIKTFLEQKTMFDSRIKPVGNMNEIPEPYRIDLIVNTTSIGLNASDALPVQGLEFHQDQIVYDVIYHRETQFLKEAKKYEATTLNGIEMLLHQGARAFEIWTGTKAPIELMREFLLKNLQKEGIQS
ncbi:MAG: shikimate dehydrogenase [Elusimicrobiota bacterium]